jgi:nitronate monooxygenase
MGTRFCATVEAPIHDNVKKLLLENDERATNLIFRKLHNTARVGKTAISDQVVEILARPDAKFEDVAHRVRGAQGRELLETGNLSAGLVWAGQVQGLIHDIPTVAELIARIVAEAREIITTRLCNRLRPLPAVPRAASAASRNCARPILTHSNRT